VADQRGHGAFDVAQGPWFEDYDDGYVYASPVFTFAPNGAELFDMTGNAREWCADWYDLGDPGPATSGTSSASGATRVLRGGSWRTGMTGGRVSARFGLAPNTTAPDVGLRCVRDVVVP
jgi:formylglycine-generating enzyme